MTDTCAALSSAPGKAGVALVRVSGSDAITVSNAVFKPLAGFSLNDIPNRQAIFGNILDSEGKRFDTGLATCFRAPHSYTGEDVVEICCHGSPVGVSMLLAALYAAGARQALPGEFTRRAFVNGKLDLTQAEAVGSLLDAESDAELRLSSAQIDGGLGRHIRACADTLTELLAAVYAAIDYPDEDMSDLTDAEISERLSALQNDLRALCRSYTSGLAVTKGVKTVIVGRPNTGKSTLFNRLSGYERAIVTDIAGTTRDVITESVVLGGIKLHLADTAGIRKTDDTVESLGVARSLDALAESELIFAMFDASVPLTEEDEELAERLAAVRESTKVVILLNKRDKADDAAVAQKKEFFAGRGFTRILALSADDESAADAVTSVLHEIYPVSEQTLREGDILINARQHAAVTSALDALARAERTLDALTRDTAGLDMEQALGYLKEADGREVSEEIVQSVFSHFCVGK